MIDRTTLVAIPDPTLTRSPAIERGIAASVAYLGSDAAMRSIEIDVYWPKWDSPWWHMLLLHELGEAQQIPARTVAAMLDGLDAFPLKIFPIHPGDLPIGANLSRDSTCHCALGSMVQVLAACSVDVARALPWIGPWFVRYQMRDGGLSCDGDAYLQVDECPSSMVGTIAPFEAMLVTGVQPAFVDRAAGFLVERGLIRGSASSHNAAERDAAASWPLLCFPRFYFYDVLRGLAALVRWAELTGHRLPWAAIAPVVDVLVRSYPDGVVRTGRRSYDGRTTIIPTADRTADRRQPAATFPLLDAVSVMGAPSEPLTRQWTAVRRTLAALIDADRLVP